MKLFTLPSLTQAILLLAGLAIPAAAQIDRTELNGVVSDRSGAILPAVIVTIKQEGTNQLRIVNSDKNGQFVASSLPIGRFSIVSPTTASTICGSPTSIFTPVMCERSMHACKLDR